MYDTITLHSPRVCHGGSVGNRQGHNLSITQVSLSSSVHMIMITKSVNSSKKKKTLRMRKNQTWIKQSRVQGKDRWSREAHRVALCCVP